MTFAWTLPLAADPIGTAPGTATIVVGLLLLACIGLFFALRHSLAQVPESFDDLESTGEATEDPPHAETPGSVRGSALPADADPDRAG